MSDAQQPDAALTIDEFCRSEKLSRRMYYKIKRQGRGPREYRLGTLVRISPAAREEWRRAREAEAANA